jgi:hypothetical protein
VIGGRKPKEKIAAAAEDCAMRCFRGEDGSRYHVKTRINQMPSPGSGLNVNISTGKAPSVAFIGYCYNRITHVVVS